MSISITQGNVQENITSAIIMKLYQLATDNNNSITLSGNLYSPTGYAYQIDYLNQTFGPNFTLTVPDTGKYIYFEDVAVETAIKNAGFSSDGIGISVQDARTATFTDSTFKQNSTITSFNEFSHFTRANTNPPNNLFQDCTSLSQIDMSNVSTVSYNEFRNTAITDVNAPNLQNFTGQCQFLDCSSLETVTNLGNVSSIPRECFRNCNSLESVVLPQSCTTILGTAFRDCSSLQSINLNSVTSIGDWTFQNCTNLAASASDLQNCVSIEQCGFWNGGRIAGNLNMPKLASCGNGAFQKTSGIQKVISLGKLSSIPSSIFQEPIDNTSLKEVYIPYECTSIGEKAFSGNQGLTTIKQYTQSVDDWIDGQPSSYGGCTRVTTLGSLCFNKCQALTGIQLGNVTYVPYGAFANCTVLQNINIRLENLSRIDSQAFFNTPLNWGVSRYLGQYFEPGQDSTGGTSDNSRQMFSGNTFKQLYLPNLKTSGMWCNVRDGYTGWSFFGSDHGVRNTTYRLLYLKAIDSLFPAAFMNADITSLVINNTVPPVCYNRGKDQTATSQDNSKDRVFFFMPSTTKIYVPDASVTAYQTADVWSTVASQIYPMSDLTQYATEADWVAAGEPDTGLIQAYM